jgi:hypothetical protein
MEFCNHCRAPRRTRRSTRNRTVRKPDGTTAVLRVDSYHCAQCGHLLRTDEYEPAAPKTAAAEETAPAAETAAAVAKEPATP